jgi:RNA polymerase sigma factor (sigma-70 family)
MCFDIKPENEKDVENMLSAYAKQVIVQSRKKFDKSHRTCLQHEELTSDGEVESFDINDVYGIENPLHIEKFIRIDFTHIEMIITDERLYKVVKSLKIKHKTILYHIFVEGKSEQEIAEMLSLTRQRVNKIKNTAINKII